MGVHEQRSRHIAATIGKIRAAIGDSATIDGLEQAKAYLRDLAAQRALFPESDFQWPTVAQKERTFCIHRGGDGRFALYVDLLNQGASNAPHDHGNSWAIVAAIEGREKHRFFRRVDDGALPGVARLEASGERTLEPGCAVSMMAGGIHSVEAVGTGRLMMLHCYDYPFEQQASRMEFDLSQNRYSYGYAAAGLIEDMPWLEIEA